MRQSNERGIAMITTLLVLMLISALLIGFTTVVMTDQRYRFIDRDRGQAFYAASAGMEKLTADLGNLFFSTLAPTNAQVTALTATAVKPSISGVTFTSSSAPGVLATSELSSYHCASPKQPLTVGANGYTVMFCADASTNPTVGDAAATIKTGAFEGLMAQKTPYQIDVTAKTSSGGEVHLVRTIEAVSIPVFQFGMFSDVDLSFFAGPNFSFGGRVHTNGNLFLSQGDGATLTLADKVTAVKEIIRQKLQNGVSIDTNPSHNGTVSMAKAPGVYRPLTRTEGSLVDGLGSAQNENTWHTISLSTYNQYIRNGRTGAKALNLPLITVGGSNPDLIRRPPVNENNTNSVLYNERLYTKASLRILLSDTAANITGLPGIVTTTAPLSLDGPDWFTAAPAGYGPVDASHPPIALTLGPRSTTVSAGSTATQIRVPNAAAIAQFRPVMTLTNGAINQAITCTAKDAANNRFTGCNIGIAVPVNSTLSTAGGVSVPVPNALAAGGNVTINVANGNTNPFMPMPFFVNGTLVTCTGWDATPSFTGCAGLGGNPTANWPISSNALSSAGTGLIGGFIKIEKQDTNGNWTDVTTEILNFGIGDANLAGTICADPTPNAIVRIQRLRDNAGGAGPTANGGGCSYAANTNGAKNATNWWPNVLFDTREALLRDVAPASGNLVLGGVMHYVTLDVANLSKWFRGTAPYNTGTGSNAKTDNGGFTVYFSDRRNNRNASNQETGEYGFEDFVNPNAANGAPDGQLNGGEDVNANNALDTYGQFPSYNGTSGSVPPGAAAPLDATARPTTELTVAQARVNRAVLFRRALKLKNGADIRSTGVTGLSIVSENPVYVEGDWNATGGNFTGAHAATAIIADAVTLLTSGWNDTDSFNFPYLPDSRARAGNSWYRVAIISGKGMAFPQPLNTPTDFGTDGGAHNFLRYLEGGGGTVNYTGSIATFFYNRQAVGTYKCCATVYSAPNRAYAFDVEFLNPALLPPNTPVFRDMNAVGFSQELRPGK